MPQCEVCKAGVQPSDGYLLTTREVVAVPRFWQTHFETHADELALSGATTYEEFCSDAGRSRVESLAGKDTPWLVCDRCIALFPVDRAEKSAFAKGWWRDPAFRPPGNGPASSAVQMKPGRCPRCRQPHSPKAARCPQCRLDLRGPQAPAASVPQERSCPVCGTRLLPLESECPKCREDRRQQARSSGQAAAMDLALATSGDRRSPGAPAAGEDGSGVTSHFNCPGCGAELTLKDHAASEGALLNCPHCDRILDWEAVKAAIRAFEEARLGREAVSAPRTFVRKVIGSGIGPLVFFGIGAFALLYAKGTDWLFFLGWFTGLVGLLALDREAFRMLRVGFKARYRAIPAPSLGQRTTRVCQLCTLLAVRLAAPVLGIWLLVYCTPQAAVDDMAQLAERWEQAVEESAERRRQLEELKPQIETRVPAWMDAVSSSQVSDDARFIEIKTESWADAERKMRRELPRYEPYILGKLVVIRDDADAEPTVDGITYDSVLESLHPSAPADVRTVAVLRSEFKERPSGRVYKRSGEPVPPTRYETVSMTIIDIAERRVVGGVSFIKDRYVPSSWITSFLLTCPNPRDEAEKREGIAATKVEYAKYWLEPRRPSAIDRDPEGTRRFQKSMARRALQEVVSDYSDTAASEEARALLDQFDD